MADSNVRFGQIGPEGHLGDQGAGGGAALTAHARPEDKERALPAGFDLHLPKPLDVRIVCRAVAELAALRRTREALLRR